MDINKSSLSSIAPFKTPPLRTAAQWYWALEVYQSSFLVVVTAETYWEFQRPMRSP